MATGTIERKGFGAIVTSLSFPYTAPDDGFILIQINPSSGSGGYAVLMINNDSNQRLQLSTANGTGNGGCIPIKKGQTASITLGNCTLATKSFIPLI